MAARIFNGLNGSEIRAVLAKELDQTLQGDARFDTLETMKVAWRWLLSVEEGDARSPTHREVSLSGNHSGSGPVVRSKITAAIADLLSRDQRFAQHLAFPRITWDWRLPMEIERVGSAVDDLNTVTKREIEIGRREDLDRTLARREGSEAGVLARQEAAMPASPGVTAGMVVTGLDGKQYRLTPVIQFRDEVPPLARDTVINQSIKDIENSTAARGIASEEHVSRFRTGTGLEIKGGPQPSPGAAAAASHSGGSPVGTIEHAELGLAHPSLKDGGMGTPDAVRRENGLPVPSVQKNARTGNVFDLPANSF